MNITYASISRAGDREYNEDYFLVKEASKGFCFVVADGLGGHGKGEVASKLVCENAVAVWEKCIKTESISDMFDFAQKQLLEKQREDNAKDAMKTTMNVVTIEQDKVYRGYVGDTRTYYFKKNKLVSRTKDHSVPQMMVYMGEIKEKDIRHHEDRNRLLRVMGTEWNKPQYSIEEVIEVDKQQALLMCTDGFWEYIEEKDIVKCLKKAKTVQEWLEKMVEIVVKKGTGYNMDNYTATGIWIN